MQISTYSLDKAKQWQDYVVRHPGTTFFHSLGWRETVKKTFKHQDHYFLASEGEKIVGILPLIEVSSSLFGKSLISLPFAVYGGVCADNEQIEKELFAAAVDLGEKLGVEHVELREQHSLKLDLPTKDLYVTFNLELTQDPDVVWKAMRKRNRNILRKGIKSGLKLYRQPVWGQVDPEELKTFYDLFARTQTALGTPVLPWDWFLNLVEAYPDQIALFSTIFEGKIINSLMVFKHKDTLLPYYIGYDPDYLQYAPNNYILWEGILFGCANGFKYYDMNRSRRDTGSYEFKRHWGIEPQQLHYQYHLYNNKEMPNLSPSNPKFDLAKRVWSKMPVSVAKVIGPKLIKYLG